MALAVNKKQRGIALITVLMILAIMVTIAATMTGRLTLGLKRTEGLTFSQKVYWYGQSSIDLGIKTLNEDFADSEVVSLDQTWATPDMVFPLDNGLMAGEFKDLRSCFNVNALAVADSENGDRATPITQFQDLLVALEIDDYGAEVIAESTRDWIDQNDSSGSGTGAEDRFYQARSVPHLAANNLMVDISELRAVQGVSQNVYARIEPYLCAIPAKDQKINVNTVSTEQAEILHALFKKYHDISISDFHSLLVDRPTSGWSNVDEFLAESLFSGLVISAELKGQLNVSSEFFQLDGVVQFEERWLAIKLLFTIVSKKAEVIRYQSGGVR